MANRQLRLMFNPNRIVAEWIKTIKILSSRLPPNHIEEPKTQILAASPLHIHSLASQQTQLDTVAD
jgi:hypothetical protein